MNTHALFRLLAALVATPLFAQLNPSQSLLPLTPGAVNVLQSYNHTAQFRFTVESALAFDDRRVGSVRFENPWFTFSWLVLEDARGTFLTGYAVGASRYHFPIPSPLFPLNGMLGQTWSGESTVVTQTGIGMTVVTPAGVFTNASRFRIAMLGQGQQEYTVVPGVGIVAAGPTSADMLLQFRGAGSPALAPAAYPAACTVAGVSAIPADPNLDYASRAGALSQALDLQPRFHVSTISWEELEPYPGSYSVNRILDEMRLADAYGMSKALIIRTVDSGIDHLPPDLRGRAWDDPLVVSRFAAAVNYLLAVLPSGVQWLHLAYEVEPYFYARPASIPAFRSFLEQVKSLVRPWTTASIGLVFGFDATKASSAVFSQLADLSDHIAFDYYALRPSANYYEVAETAPRTDIPIMLHLVGGKQVILTEVGYSSSTAAGGGSSQQAAFFQNVLGEIRKTQGQIAAVNVWALNDMPFSAAASTAMQYGVYSTANVQFLSSLGLRTTSGWPKPAYTQVKSGFINFALTPSCSQ